jgi:hypothetical protein
MAGLDVAASAVGMVSLAIQIGENIKLNNFWDSVKEVPKEVLYLMEEIDALSFVLSHIMPTPDGEFDRNPAPIQRTVELCRKVRAVLSWWPKNYTRRSVPGRELVASRLF